VVVEEAHREEVAPLTDSNVMVLGATPSSSGWVASVAQVSTRALERLEGGMALAHVCSDIWHHVELIARVVGRATLSGMGACRLPVARRRSRTPRSPASAAEALIRVVVCDPHAVEGDGGVREQPGALHRDAVARADRVLLDDRVVQRQLRRGRRVVEEGGRVLDAAALCHAVGAGREDRVDSTVTCSRARIPTVWMPAPWTVADPPPACATSVLSRTTVSRIVAASPSSGARSMPAPPLTTLFRLVTSTRLPSKRDP
jgi:hypothetical protein